MTGERYIRRFGTVCGLMQTEEIKAEARGQEKKIFVWNRKMPVCDIIRSIAVRKGLTEEMELKNYFCQRAKKEGQISKQGYFQQRKKLNPEVFRKLNRAYLKDFYGREEEVRTWNGYVVFTIDGTKAEIPNSEENRKTFGMRDNRVHW
jgi:hypothetical protein